MIELVITIATLTVVIFAWSKISKSLDWTGARIGETTDMLSDLTLSGRDGTAQARLAMRSKLEDSAVDFEKKAAARAKTRKEFKDKLDKDQLAEVAKKEKFANQLLNR